MHVERAPSREALATLRRRFGDFDGVASRDADGMPQALAGTNLLFFDELGTADPAAFALRRVRLDRRDTTVDDRTDPSYVRFMLDRAAERSRSEGRVTVLLRPAAGTVRALTSFIRSGDAEIVPIP